MDFELALDKMPDKELCIIAADKGDLRYEYAVRQLKLRGITPEKEAQIWSGIVEQEQKNYDESMGVLQANENIEYSFPYKAAILCLGPLLLFSHFKFITVFIFKPFNLNYLKENNFQKKIEQRKELLIVGFILWAIYIVCALKFH